MSARAPARPRAGLPGGTTLKPIAFVGRVDGVEIWQVEHAFIDVRDKLPHHFHHIRDAVMFGAFSRRKNLFVGILDMRLVPIDKPCSTDLGKLRVASKMVYQIAGSSLLPEFFNKGIGVALYVAAAAYAHRVGGYPIAADACFDSSTSDEAKRVWRSKRFREHVTIGPSGLVAIYRPGAAAKVVATADAG